MIQSISLILKNRSLASMEAAMLKRAIVSGFLAILCSIAVLAQITATIVGTVNDSSGARVAGAAITVINEETGLKRGVRSNEHGLYVVPSLPVGSYSVSAEAAGFKRKTLTGLVVQVNQEARIDLA